jgi:hypothetical protein
MPDDPAPAVQDFRPVADTQLRRQDRDRTSLRRRSRETLRASWCITIRKNRREEFAMSKFCFSVSGVGTRHEGIIESDSFLAAVDALADHVDVRTGDVLEIGVTGFPPARYECVGEIKSIPVWMPTSALAA